MFTQKYLNSCSEELPLSTNCNWWRWGNDIYGEPYIHWNTAIQSSKFSMSKSKEFCQKNLWQNIFEHFNVLNSSDTAHKEDSYKRI